MGKADITSSIIDEKAVENMESITENISAMTLTQIWETYRWPLLTSLIVLVVGYFMVRLLVSFAAKGLLRSRLDKSAHHIILSSLRILLWLVVVLTVASCLGIPMTSTLALFSVFALAVSLAVKDGLSHFAGGIMILASKPFAVGDIIESKADDVIGCVTEIGLVHTKLRTFDNKQIFIPNGTLIASTIINYTGAGLRRLDLTFPIAYNEDYKKAQALIAEVVERHPTVLREKEPVIRVTALGASSVDIICRVWVNKDDYENTKFDLLEGVKSKFDEAGVEIPFNQLDLHLRDGAVFKN